MELALSSFTQSAKIYAQLFRYRLMNETMENVTSTEISTHEEIIEQLVKKVGERNERRPNFPDYTKEFEQLKINMNAHLLKYGRSMKEIKHFI